MKVKQYIRILLGLFFIVTAILKILSIDEFEIYLYSFGFFNYTLCSVLSRLLIIFELILGLFFILKIYNKQSYFLIFLSYIFFTLFLCYTAIFRDDTNCHCMGDIIELNPIESIIKNIITIGLLLYIRKQEPKKYKKRIVITTILAPIIAVCFIIPTDNLYNLIYTDTSSMNIEEFTNSLKDSSLLNRITFIENEEDLDSSTITTEIVNLDNINNKSLLIGVLSSGCKYCTLSMKKLNLIFENNNLDKRRFIVFIWSDISGLKEFIRETNAYGYEYRIISPITAINLSYGEFPTFAMLKNGEVSSTINYSSLNEKEIIDFFKD